MKHIYILKSFLFVFAITMVSVGTVMGQKLTVELNSKTYKSDTIIIGNYFADKHLVIDTLVTKDKKFVWRTDTMPRPGVYFALLKPNDKFFQILINGMDSKMSFDFDINDLENVKASGSQDNKNFSDYVFFLKDKSIMADTIRKQMDRLKKDNLPTKELEDKFAALDKEVKAYQAKITSNPDHITTMLINSGNETTIPEYHGTEQEVQVKKYQFYKEHYFDNLYMSHPAVIRTPFIHQKIDFYMTKGISQEPDTLIKGIDRVLHLFEGNKYAYDYYLSYFLNKFGQMKMVGHDAVVLHLADKYYLAGKASWSTQESLDKLKTNVDEIRPTLIGKTMPNFTTYKQDGSPVTLNSIKSEYTLMVVWDPDCGNCKKTMPFVVDFYDKHKDKGVTVISICSKGGEKANTCWPFITEKKMEKFINTGDEYQRWTQIVPNNKTPKIFIMDRNKKILMKDMSGEDLEKIFLQIYEYDQKKAKGEIK